MPVTKYQVIGPWTINNPTEDDFNHVRNAVTDGHCKYLVFCHEHKDDPEHTYHLQGFSSSAKGPYSIKKWHEIIGPRFALDPKFSGVHNKEACIQYCKGIKDGQPKPGSGEVEEFGELKQGSRTDIHDAVASIVSGKRTYDAIIEHPGAIQAYKALQDIERETKRRKAHALVQSEFDTITWKPWQQAILDTIETKADNRKVTWLYEETGNVGKSTITRYLASTGKAYTPDISKVADMYYGYNYEPVIIFDIPRSKADHIDHFYTAVEQFKNGNFTSIKYEPRHMLFPSPHVIVFANFKPDTSKLSMDRWDIIPIVDQQCSEDNPLKRKHDEEEYQQQKKTFLESQDEDTFPKSTVNFRRWRKSTNSSIMQAMQPS